MIWKANSPRPCEWRTSFARWASKSELRFCVGLGVIFGSGAVLLAAWMAAVAWILQ